MFWFPAITSVILTQPNLFQGIKKYFIFVFFGFSCSLIAVLFFEIIVIIIVFTS